jgi:hypothetical protein
MYFAVLMISVEKLPEEDSPKGLVQQSSFQQQPT